MNPTVGTSKLCVPMFALVSLLFATPSLAQTLVSTSSTSSITQTRTTTSALQAGEIKIDASGFDAFLDGEARPKKSTTSSLNSARQARIERFETFDDRALSSSALFIEAIEIIGNTKTSQRFIKQRIQVSVGEVLNDAKVDESRLRLLSTGYFKRVEFSLRRGSQRGKVLLVVEIEERNTILIDEIFLGFSTVTPVFGGLGVVERNFLGQGVSVGGNFVIGKQRRAGSLRFFVPTLANTPLQLSGSAIFLQGAEVLNELDPSGPQLEYERFGGSLGLGFSAGPAQRVTLTYRLESVTADRLPNLEPAVLRGAPSIQFDDSVLSTLSLTYERDTRDDPFVPTQGHRIALDVEIGTSLIGSSYEFSKYTAAYSQAFGLFSTSLGKHSLVLDVIGGLIQGQAPFFNQYFISDHAYFAFGRDSLPRNAQLNFSESSDYDDLLISATATYSIPVYNGGNWLYSTYIYGGLNISATASLDELQEDPNGRGTGGNIPLSFDAGLKFDTLIGNFRLSLSYMLDLVF